MRFILDAYAGRNRYIKNQLWKFIVPLFWGFLLAAIISYFAMAYGFSNRITEVFEYFYNMLENSGMMEKSGFSMFWGFFVHNLRATGMQAISGMVPFFFFPAWHVLSGGISNGLIFGLFTAAGADMGQLFRSFFCLYLPHSIFELSAMFLANAMGMHFCLFITFSGFLQYIFGLLFLEEP